MKQIIYSIVGLLAMINSLANASERQNPSPQSLRRALSLKNVPPINLWQEEVLADDSVKITAPLERTGGVYGFPNTDLISFGTNCDFPDNDLYPIEGVKDMLECGTRYCFGNRMCSHFVFNKSTSKCFLKSRFGYGTKGWVTKSATGHCGFIPVRACDVNTASNNIAKILLCLTLDV